tara:strand:- start:42 stop:233 length:192 start_codon:yes stop_codon:yes gene_type:complete
VDWWFEVVKGGGLYNKFPKPEIDVIFIGIFYKGLSVFNNFFYMESYGLHDTQFREKKECDVVK